MKYLLLAIISLLPCFAQADEASHHAAAVKLIDAIKSKEIMRNAFMAFLDAMPPETSAQISAAQMAEMKKAMTAWFDEDFKWEDLQPKLADIYVRAFTEDELNQLTAFYQTPLGQKTLSQLPQVMKEGAALGQQYATSKQGMLMDRLQKVDQKYHPAPGAAPAATTAAPPKS